LISTTTRLNYLTEAPSSCGPEGANFAAFVEATSNVRGRDVVEEFLASGLWPLGKKFGFEVERKESPLSKVVVPMPQINTVIRADESRAEFEARIMNATNLLVGKYNIPEHNAYQGLRHELLNHVFELAGVLCQPRLEPIVRKCKPAATAPALVLRKTRTRGKTI
jgi:hypothetical protein